MTAAVKLSAGQREALDIALIEYASQRSGHFDATMVAEANDRYAELFGYAKWADWRAMVARRLAVLESSGVLRIAHQESSGYRRKFYEKVRVPA